MKTILPKKNHFGRNMSMMSLDLPWNATKSTMKKIVTMAEKVGK